MTAPVFSFGPTLPRLDNSYCFHVHIPRTSRTDPISAVVHVLIPQTLKAVIAVEKARRENSAASSLQSLTVAYPLPLEIPLRSREYYSPSVRNLAEQGNSKGSARGFPLLSAISAMGIVGYVKQVMRLCHLKSAATKLFD